MNSKVLIAAVAGLVGLAASADVLYWQVNNTAADAEGATKSEYSYAILRATTGTTATDGDQYYVNMNLDASGSDAGAALSRSFFGDGNYAGAVMDASKILSTTTGSQYAGSVSALSFFIELYDSAGNWVGETSPIKSYQQLVDSGTISGFNANFQGVNAALGSAVAGSYQAVPEPTSGLLMLIGMGALALRRRKVA